MFGPMVKNCFAGELIVIRDSNIKKEVEERLSGLDVLPLSIVIKP